MPVPTEHVVARMTEWSHSCEPASNTKYSTPCGFEPPEPPPDANDVDDIEMLP
eukprot:CAMPEP_0182588850 /NCGR_PEP_ID=MMETSP1324-20130603/68190_1 /TAXON_ID=236786 /ORGANISM="Florenciella sp., Strain RCC1587" /LENGTH=52 /DNA_ID=CAMNT_0024805957 /DNA_START=29 /DNA_END=184 /DNA_ORIENTATION=+